MISPSRILLSGCELTVQIISLRAFSLTPAISAAVQGEEGGGVHGGKG